MLHWLGSPTGAIGTTGALALMTLGTVVGAGTKKLGFGGFWKAQVPHMDVPPALGIFLKPMVFVIEFAGLMIKHFVLAVRLLANMFAGHLVLGVLVAFVATIANHPSVESYFDPLFLGELAGTVCCFLTGIHLHVLVGPVYRYGRASALSCQGRDPYSLRMSIQRLFRNQEMESV
jgi:F0F1-type ATP synthase membrane subunit a